MGMMMSDLIQKKIEETMTSIGKQMDAHLIESVVSLFDKGILVHKVRTPRCTLDPTNYRMNVESASGVYFEGRERIIELEKENTKLKAELKSERALVDQLAMEGDDHYRYILHQEARQRQRERDI